MRRSSRILAYLAVAITALFISAIPSVEAAFMMKVSSGSDSIIVSDNGAGDFSGGTTGVITFYGAVGNFTFNIAVGSSKPFIGSATNPMLNITSFNATSMAGGALTIELSDTGFGPVGPSAMFGTYLNSTLAPGSIAAQTYFANGDANFTHANAVGSVGPLSGFSSGSDSRVASPGSQFSMNMVATVVHTAGQLTTFDATATAVSVPEPSATLCLGIALFGIAGYAGWQRRKTTT
jgi:hypothetical protein